MSCMPELLRRAALRLAERTIASRAPDFVIGADDPHGPYLLRWYLTPWRRWSKRWWGWLPNVYVHEFLRSDDDRALHDHPSWAVSLMVLGSYTEHTIAYGGTHRRELIERGRLRFMPSTHAHRVELHAGPCLTLFMFGPYVRHWGFHCPERGWVPWEEFTAEGRPGERGKGCEA